MSILTRARAALVRSVSPLLSQDCLLCAGSAGADLLCAACAAGLPLLPAARCPRCALPNPMGETCGACLAHPRHFDSAQALYRYDFPLDKLIQSFKYAHRLALGTWFGRRMAEAAAADPALATVDGVVPLPLHPDRLRERGFNQARELARPVATALGKPLPLRLCERQRPTASQAALPWRERAGNMRSAFHCRGDLGGMRILLVDDVMTTGTSLDECARTLKLHGASTVHALVLARALPPGEESAENQAGKDRSLA